MTTITQRLGIGSMEMPMLFQDGGESLAAPTSDPLVVTVGDVPNAPTISGFAPDTAITAADYTSVDTATAGATGQWAFVTGSYADGSQSFTASATDQSGDTTNSTVMSAPLDVNVESTAPTAAISGATEQGADNSTLVLAGTTTGAADGYSTVAIDDGAQLLGTAAVAADGTWTFQFDDAAYSSHSFTARVTDAANTTSTPSNPLVVTVAPSTPAGETPPTPTIGAGPDISATGQTADQNLVTLLGTADNGDYINVYYGRIDVYYDSVLLGSATVGSDGTWVFTADQLSYGAHALTASANDGQGLNIPNVIAADYVSGNALTLSGTDPTGILSQSRDRPSTFSKGHFALAVTVGHIQDAPTIYGFAPDLAITAAGYTSENMLTLDGTADAGNTMSVFDGTTLLGSATTGANGQWSFVTDRLADGSHIFTALATDQYGDTISSNLMSAPLDVNVESAAPTAAISGATEQGADNSTLVLAGTTTGAADGYSTVAIDDGAQLLGTAAVAADGTWTFQFDDAAYSSHSFTAQVTDAANTTSTPSDEYYLAGSGSVTMTAGSGSNTFEFDFLTAAARTDILTDFTSGVDHLKLVGYATNELATDLSKAVSDGLAGSLLSLSDGTHLDFANIAVASILNMSATAFA